MSRQACRELTKRGREDPLWWIRTALGGEPWSRQVEILESVRDNEETAVKSCHGAGKDWIAAHVALWFLYCHSKSLVLTTGPTDRQVKGILWKEIGSAWRDSKRDLGGHLLEQRLMLDRDWFAWGFTAPEYDPNRFQGFHADHVLVIIDEAAGVSKDIYTAIETVLTGAHCHKLEIGNPTDPISEFAQSFKTPGISKISINAFDTPNFTRFGITEEDIATGAWEQKLGDSELPQPKLVTPHWVSKRYKRWGKDSPLYLSRVKAQFPVEGKNTLIPLHLIEAAQQRDLKPTEPIELGVDVARDGDDNTVIAERRGPVVRIRESYSKANTMETAGYVKRALDATKAEVAKIDVVGIGAGVVDRCKEQGLQVRESNAGAGSIDKERYLNARAEWFWGLRERFEDGDIDIDPNDEDLAAQLSAIKWKPDSRGRVKIEPKEEMKTRLGRSPDDADAVAIAFGRPTEEEEIEWSLV